MKPRTSTCLFAGVLALGSFAACSPAGSAAAAEAATATTTAAPKPLSDLVSPEKRRVIVELAERLTRPPVPAPVPADLVQPFNPAGFDQPDPEELRAAAAASAKAGGMSPGGGGGGAAAMGPNQPARQPGDRETLENLAGKLQTTGTMIFNGEPLLLLGRARVRVGDHFGVQDKSNGQEYELELVAITSTTFTLRYHGEEITRSTKIGKPQ